MPGYERVLVAIDFSDCAWEVCERALAIAGPSGAEVVLTHVVELPDGVTRRARIHHAGQEDEAAQVLHGVASERLTGYDALFREAGLTVRHHLAEGPIDEAIVAAATALDADLVVMGTHGRKGVSRAVLGSVAEKVVRSAPVPVLTVRSTRKDTCRAASCAWCTTHVTPEQSRVADEAMG